MRVLITASRSWSRPDIIRHYLDEVYDWWLDHCRPGPDDEFIVVHGDADGGDAIAKQWARQHPDPRVDEDSHAAKWDQPCGENCRHLRHRRDGVPYYSCAGHVRNGEMVRSGIDICMGFPLDGPGTRGCLKLAKAANILTGRFKDGKMEFPDLVDL